MSGKARIGVIGAGWWAVVNHIPVLQKIAECEVVAVNRLGAAELAQVQQTFGVAAGFEDYREMLEAVPMDGVVISSPHHLHFEHAAAALRKGLHVVVEKPLATSADEARQLVALAHEAGREIIVAYGWNFMPWTEPARRLAAGVGRVEHVMIHMAGALEDLFAGQPLKETEGAMFRPPASTWADPKLFGGFGWGQLVHILGLMFRLVDDAPDKVFAFTGKSPADVDYYDAVSVRFAGGAVGAFSGSATVPKHRGYQVEIRIFGSEGMLLLDIERDRERLELRRRDGQDEIVPMAPGSGAYACVGPLEALVDICRGVPRVNSAPGEVGARAVEVLEALYRSAESGRAERV